MKARVASQLESGLERLEEGEPLAEVLRGIPTDVVADVTPLLRAAAQLRSYEPAPSTSFEARMEATLNALPTQQDAPRRRPRRWAWRAAGALAAVVMAVAGLDAASADARPGEPMWPVRAVIERAAGWWEAVAPGAWGGEGPATPAADASGDPEPDGGAVDRSTTGGAADSTAPTAVRRAGPGAAALARPHDPALPAGPATARGTFVSATATATPRRLAAAVGTPTVPRTAPAVSAPGDAGDAGAGDGDGPTPTPRPSSSPTSPDPGPSGATPSATPTRPRTGGGTGGLATPTITASATAPPAPTGTMTACRAMLAGRVRLPDGGLAIGAEVEALRIGGPGMPPTPPAPGPPPTPDPGITVPRTRTDGEGRYVLAGLCPGEYFVLGRLEHAMGMLVGWHGEPSRGQPRVLSLSEPDTRRMGVDVRLQLAPPPGPTPGRPAQPTPGATLPRQITNPTATPSPPGASATPAVSATPGAGATTGA